MLRIFGADRRNQSAARSAAKGVPGTLAAMNERPSAARSISHPMVLRTIAGLPEQTRGPFHSGARSALSSDAGGQEPRRAASCGASRR
jgi:hypothetical protein